MVRNCKINSRPIWTELPATGFFFNYLSSGLNSSYKSQSFTIKESVKDFPNFIQSSEYTICEVFSSEYQRTTSKKSSIAMFWRGNLSIQNNRRKLQKSTYNQAFWSLVKTIGRMPDISLFKFSVTVLVNRSFLLLRFFFLFFFFFFLCGLQWCTGRLCFRSCNTGRTKDRHP